jgi:hydroxymethylbilane synthase
VQDLLKAIDIDSEIVAVETKGDKILDVSISKIGSKGVFTEEIEAMLASGEVDIAVHSAKDMQSTLPEGFELIAFGEREKVNDVLVSHNTDLNIERDTLTIGTSSTRRIAFLNKFYPHLKTTAVRGNLQTRIRKMEEGVCDALLLAYAGAHRMSYDTMIVHEFDAASFIPAVGQGSIAIEIHESCDKKLAEKVGQAVNHEVSEITLRAERAYLKAMNGGCSIPVFGLAKIEGDKVILNGGIISLDGQNTVAHRTTSSIKSPEIAGKALGKYVLENGGREILEAIRKEQT